MRAGADAGGQEAALRAGVRRAAHLRRRSEDPRPAGEDAAFLHQAAHQLRLGLEVRHRGAVQQGHREVSAVVRVDKAAAQFARGRAAVGVAAVGRDEGQHR